MEVAVCAAAEQLTRLQRNGRSMKYYLSLQCNFYKPSDPDTVTDEPCVFNSGTSTLLASSSIKTQMEINYISIRQTNVSCGPFWVPKKNIHWQNNPRYVSHYTPFEDTLNMDGIPTPVPITSIPRFERLNNRSVNIYVLRWNRTQKKHDVDPLCISAAKQPQHINLLYISNEKGQSHYVWIKNLSRLVHGQASLHKESTSSVIDVFTVATRNDRSINIQKNVKNTGHNGQFSPTPTPN